MDEEQFAEIDSKIIEQFYQLGRYEGALNSLTGIIEVLEKPIEKEIEPEFIIDSLCRVLKNRLTYARHMVDALRAEIERDSDDD